MAQHFKKDGTPDMRYSSSRAAVSSSGGGGSSASSSGYSGSSYSSPNPSAGSSYRSVPVSSPSPSSNGGDAVHLKKDGTPDMRYASSRAAVFTEDRSTYQQALSPSAYPTSPSADLHFKKDGSLDMRYSSSQQQQTITPPPVSRLPSTPESSPLHLKKDGTPDMRFKSSQISTGGLESGMQRLTVKSNTNNGIPDFGLHYKKDGSLDMRYKASKDAVASGALQYQLNARDAYWAHRLEDSYFTQKWSDQCGQSVAVPKMNDFQPNDIASLRLEFRQLSEAQSRQSNTSDTKQTVSLPDDIQVIPYDELALTDGPGQELGKGAFGVVVKANWNGQIVAVKKLHLAQLTRTERVMFEREVCILARLGRHENLVQFHGYCLTPPSIVMEYVDLGSLSYLLHYCEDVSVETKLADGRIKRNIVIGIADGMKALHAVHVVHGDMKPPNVLVTGKWIAKITDFGLANLRVKTSSTIKNTEKMDNDVVAGGTAGYMAPELLDSVSPLDFTADVYAFGVLLNELVTEEEPYADQAMNIAGRGPYGVVNYAKMGYRPRIREGIPDNLVRLIQACWSGNVQMRPSFAAIQVTVRASDFLIPNSNI